MKLLIWFGQNRRRARWHGIRRCHYVVVGVVVAAVFDLRTGGRHCLVLACQDAGDEACRVPLTVPAGLSDTVGALDLAQGDHQVGEACQHPR